MHKAVVKKIILFVVFFGLAVGAFFLSKFLNKTQHEAPPSEEPQKVEEPVEAEELSFTPLSECFLWDPPKNSGPCLIFPAHPSDDYFFEDQVKIYEQTKQRVGINKECPNGIGVWGVGRSKDDILEGKCIDIKYFEPMYPCINVSVAERNESYIFEFDATCSKGAHEYIEWDLGDETKVRDKYVVEHQYTKSGSYVVLMILQRPLESHTYGNSLNFYVPSEITGLELPVSDENVSDNYGKGCAIERTCNDFIFVDCQMYGHSFYANKTTGSKVTGNCSDPRESCEMPKEWQACMKLISN